MSFILTTAICIALVTAIGWLMRRIRRSYAAARRDEMRVAQWTDRPPPMRKEKL